LPSTALIASLDVGTSSVRTLLFDVTGAQQRGFGKQSTYQIQTTPDGGVAGDPALLLNLCVETLDTLHGQMQAKGLTPVAIGMDTFWHSFLGVDKNGLPTTPLIHLFDTRSTQEAAELERELDGKRIHQLTGCRLHPSYWPAKLLWLSKNRKQEFDSTDRWISLGEYAFLQFFGTATASTSMVSGSGLWNQLKNDYEDEILAKLRVSRTQLAAPDTMDGPATKLIGPYREKWPLFDNIPWYPALGDGACNNIGSGCTTAKEFALMVGTSGAMRAVIESDTVQIPDGLWCYRVDRKRFILGGALSNGGDVYAWMRRTLALPGEAEIEHLLQESKPGAHGLLLLPFFAGERSPYWRADLRAAMTGLSLSTKPMDILQAALESVSLRFREIFKLMTESLGQPEKVIASGGALLASGAWSQMMADALGLDIVPCLEREATGRGAALLAAERSGLIAGLTNVPVNLGPVRKTQPEHTAQYEAMLDNQRKLYKKLFLDP
jgi:gluconokinase